MGNSSRCFIALNKCQVELLLFFGVLNFDISMSFRMNETWCDFRKYSMMYDTWWPIVFKYFNPGTKVIHHEAQQWRHWNARRKWRNRNSLGANSHRRIVKIEKKTKTKRVRFTREKHSSSSLAVPFSLSLQHLSAAACALVFEKVSHSNELPERLGHNLVWGKQ